MSQDDLSARVRRLELIELAKTATINYARACDRKAVDELRTSVFTSDAALHVPYREFRGIDDVAGFYHSAFAAEPGSRRHFLTNQLADVVGEDRFRVESYFVFLSADARWVIGGASTETSSSSVTTGRASPTRPSSSTCGLTASLRQRSAIDCATMAANRDPAQFDRPAEFVIDRSPNRHVGFGFGLHFALVPSSPGLKRRSCFPGCSQVSRLRLACDPSALSWHPTIVGRTLKALPVVLD